MDYYLKEMLGKRPHDHFEAKISNSATKFWMPGPVIVGAGPSGLATAACLKERGIQSLILEKSSGIASLWKLRTYDRLRLHLPKKFCELPLMPFPSNFPTYPTKQQFVEYLESYAQSFDIKPVFNSTVVSAEFDHGCELWRVKTVGPKMEEAEYMSQWLIVATGENAEKFVPKIEGMEEFVGPIVHTSSYKRGACFRDKNVLVIGCGNSGMEVCLDLYNYNARPSLVVRDSMHIVSVADSKIWKDNMAVVAKENATPYIREEAPEVHVLPQEMLGRSTFGLSMRLLKWLPMRLVDHFLLLISRLMLGDTAQYGLKRPKLGPLALKSISGKTPVLDVGTLSKIRDGHIKVYPGIRKLTPRAAEFVDGRVEKFDAIVLATGYKSNVPTWLKEANLLSEKDGMLNKPFPAGWKGECGLYAVGFTKRGLVGTSEDAKKIAEHIEKQWRSSEEPSLICTTTTVIKF